MKPIVFLCEYYTSFQEKDMYNAVVPLLFAFVVVFTVELARNSRIEKYEKYIDPSLLNYH